MITEEADLQLRIEALFRACCAEENNGRYTITEPFIRDGFRYATDGKICVRTPTTLPDTKPIGPDAGRLGWNAKTGDPLKLPHVEIAYSTCDHEGCCDGFVTCDYGHEHECPDCGGAGSSDNRLESAPISPGVSLGLGYIRKLLDCGITEVRPDAKNPYRYPVHFSLGDAHGLLLPIAKEET